VNGEVETLAVSGSTLYAGGTFTTAGGSNVNYIAQWDGTNWSSPGSGVSSGRFNDTSVTALAVSGSDLYVGGTFITAGDIAATNIAKWDGSSWSALGSGTGGPVVALAVSGSTLYAGGDFITAGGKLSAYAAYADMASLGGTPGIITNNPAFGFTNGVFGFNVAGPAGSSVAIDYSADLKTWIPLQTNLLGDGPLYFSDPGSTASQHRFYRARILP
jgi:hypothetical protein